MEETQTVQRDPLSQEILQRVLWLREQLLCWFEQHRRSFPWRESVKSSFELVVAEILLQRTTAAQVAHAFPGFVARYPTWEAVARTPLEELQISLRPLGLWRRKAQVFLDLANEVEKNSGVLPCSRRDLERLPGITNHSSM
jgi:A/G-specific adenine glycosylase